MFLCYSRIIEYKPEIAEKADSSHMPRLEQEKLIDYVDKMPAFPNSVQKVVQMTSDINSPAKEIIRVIECDPVMTVKILKVINSACYGLPKKITSIQRAVVYIGMNTIKNLALSVAAIGMLEDRKRAGFDTNGFLMHSLTTALISKLLGERLGRPQAECSDYFVAGLLHDFGKVVFAECAFHEYLQAVEKASKEQLSLHLTESEFLGINHAQAGKMLAEKWELAGDLIETIEHHHDLQRNNPFADCIFTANQISKKMQFGEGGNPVVEQLPDIIADRFGLQLEELVQSLGDLSYVKAEANAFLNL